MEFFIINSHRKGIHLNNAMTEVHLVEVDVLAKDPVHRIQKMPLIIIGVKTNEVGTEHSFQDLLPPGKGSENLIGREGDMVKEADGNVDILPSHQLGKQQ